MRPEQTRGHYPADDHDRDRRAQVAGLRAAYGAMGARSRAGMLVAGYRVAAKTSASCGIGKRSPSGSLTTRRCSTLRSDRSKWIAKCSSPKTAVRPCSY